jgi:RNA polymerase sigma factor (sigma-70 family)
LGTLAAPGVSATARGRTDVTDQELVQAVRAGDDHAFERLYHRYHRRIAAYLFGMVRDHGRAEDLTQEVFVSALRRMRQTERPIAFKPWIYEIAKNASIDAFRRAKRTEEVSYDADEGLGAADQVKLAATSQSPDAAIGTKESLDHLCGAFGGLSDAHHQILVLRELEGLSYAAIGERLGMSRASVESTLFRARRRLTEEYEELVTGERCLRIQGIIAGTAAGRALGLRDTRRVGSHIFHCQPCRRQAVLAGLDAAVLARRPVRGKIAALLPLPAFLRRRWLPGGSGDAAAQAAGGHGVSLAQVSMTAAQYGEPTMSAWMKGAAVATAVAVAGVGTGAVDHGRGAGARHDGGAAAATAAAAQQRSVAAVSGAGAATARAAGARAAGSGSRSGATKSSGRRRLRASAGTVVRHRVSENPSSSSGSGAGSGGGAGAGGSTGAGSGSGAGSGAGSGSSSGGSSGASSPSGTTASTKPQSTKGSSGATSTGTGAVQQTASDAGSTAGSTTDTGTGAATGSTQQPLIQPDLTKLTQPPADAAPPTSVGGVVSGATDAVGGTVGGQVGTVVQETGQAVGDTVDDVTDGVGAVLGGLLGHK